MHSFIHVCMYARVHVCRYACMQLYVPEYQCAGHHHTYIHTRRTCVHVRTHAQVPWALVCMRYQHTCMHAHIHACMHTYMHACTHTCMHACTHTCMHAHIHACMHTYMHACMHTYMHPSTLNTCARQCFHTYMKIPVYAYTQKHIHTGALNTFAVGVWREVSTPVVRHMRTSPRVGTSRLGQTGMCLRVFVRVRVMCVCVCVTCRHRPAGASQSITICVCMFHLNDLRMLCTLHAYIHTYTHEYNAHAGTLGRFQTSRRLGESGGRVSWLPTWPRYP
jgi:hypothetical protein